MKNFAQKVAVVWLISAGFIALGSILYVSRFLVLMSLLGVGLGVLVSPLLTLMRSRLRIPRILSALIFLAGTIGTGILVLYGLSLLVEDQIRTLSERAPDLIANLKDRWEDIAKNYPWIENSVEGVSIEGAFVSGVQEMLRGMRMSFTFLTGLVIALVLGLFTAVSSRYYQAGLIRAFPSAYRETATKLSTKAAQTLRQWFRAQLLDMAIIGAMTSIGLWYVEAQYWAVFGLLTAVLGLIPYLGILIVVVLATLVTFAASPEKVPWVLTVFLITQQVEGNLILPLVMRERIEIPEVPLMIFLLLMGAWFGFAGVLIATPTFAVLRMLYLELYLQVES